MNLSMQDKRLHLCVGYALKASVKFNHHVIIFFIIVINYLAFGKMEMLIFVNKANYFLKLDHLTDFLFIDGLLNIYII